MRRIAILFSYLVALSTGSPIAIANSSAAALSLSVGAGLDVSHPTLANANTSTTAFDKSPYPPAPFLIPFNTHPGFNIKVIRTDAYIPALNTIAIATLDEAVSVISELDPTLPGPADVFILGLGGRPYLTCTNAVSGGPITWDVATAADFFLTLKNVVIKKGFLEFRRFLIEKPGQTKPTPLATCKWKKEKKGKLPGDGDDDATVGAQVVTFS